jgi:hypothetical protein
MNTLLFKCPDCAHQMQLPEAMIGQKGECPNCSEVIVPIPVLGSLSQEQASPPKPAADLPTEPEPPPAATDDGASSDEPEGKEVDSEKTGAESANAVRAKELDGGEVSRGSHFVRSNLPGADAQRPKQSAPNSGSGTDPEREVAPCFRFDWWPSWLWSSDGSNEAWRRGMGTTTFAKKHLVDGETIIHAGRFHPTQLWVLKQSYLSLVIGISILWLCMTVIILISSAEDMASIKGVFQALIAFILILGASGLLTYLGIVYFTNVVYKTELVLTDKRIIAKWGFLRTGIHELPLDKIESINYGQSVIERWFVYGVGRLTVRGTGGSKIKTFKYLVGALEFRKKILDQIDKVSGS